MLSTGALPLLRRPIGLLWCGMAAVVCLRCHRLVAASHVDAGPLGRRGDGADWSHRMGRGKSIFIASPRAPDYSRTHFSALSTGQ